MRPQAPGIRAGARRALRDLGVAVQHAAAGFSRDRCAQMAAAISFWALFSIFPLVMALVAVAGLFVDRSTVQHEVIDWVTSYVSVTPEGRADLERMLSGAVSGLGAIGLVGLVGLVWSASALMSAVRNGVDAAWSTTVRRHFLRGKVLDLGLVTALGALFALSIAATFLARFAQGLVPEGSALDDVVTAAWGLSTWLVPFVVSTASFLLAYRILPPVRTRIRDVWVGAAIAGVLFEVAKAALAIYFQRFATYDEVYGSLGAVITFLFFVYVAACILLLGAELAATWPRVRAGALGGESGGGDLRDWLHEQIEEITAPKPADEPDPTRRGE